MKGRTLAMLGPFLKIQVSGFCSHLKNQATPPAAADPVAQEWRKNSGLPPDHVKQ